jgi:hypothetical protein
MASAALLTGCLGSDGGPSATERAIDGTIQRLERDTARRDFAAICDDLLTASARARAGGPDCVRLTRAAAAGVDRPRIDVRKLEVDGATATVTVATRAAGQPELSERLVLRRERGRWRIDSLGG